MIASLFVATLSVAPRKVTVFGTDFPHFTYTFFTVPSSMRMMFTPKSMRQMNKEDKIRACYQHCCLQYVAGGKKTNESLRGRLNIASSNYSIASRIISDTINAGLIKLEDSSICTICS